MNVLDKEGLVKEISEEELNALVEEFGELIEYSSYSNSLEREDDIVDIQDGRCNKLYVKSCLMKYIPGFLEDEDHFTKDDFYVFESVETHLTPVILKYNGKIYYITPASWKPREKAEWEIIAILKKENKKFSSWITEDFKEAVKYEEKIALLEKKLDEINYICDSCTDYGDDPNKVYLVPKSAIKGVLRGD